MEIYTLWLIVIFFYKYKNTVFFCTVCESMCAAHEALVEIFAESKTAVVKKCAPCSK